MQSNLFVQGFSEKAATQLGIKPCVPHLSKMPTMQPFSSFSLSLSLSILNIIAVVTLLNAGCVVTSPQVGML